MTTRDFVISRPEAPECQEISAQVAKNFERKNGARNEMIRSKPRCSNKRSTEYRGMIVQQVQTIFVLFGAGGDLTWRKIMRKWIVTMRMPKNMALTS